GIRMDRKSGLLPLLLIALVTGALYPRATEHATAQTTRQEASERVKAPPTSAGADAAKEQARGALDLMAETLGGEVGVRDRDANALDLVRHAAQAAGVSVRFLIATVPDAIDSYAGWQFDPTVDAIQQAAATSGYILDRFYVPDLEGESAAHG